MPKMKTKKAAAKRFRILPSGKIKRNKANKAHLLTDKTRSRKNNLKNSAIVTHADHRRTRRCLPNG